MVLLDKRTLRLKTKVKLPIWSGIFFFFSNVQMKKQRQKLQITDVHDWVFPVSNTTSLTLCDLATRVCRALVSLLRAHPSAVYPVMLELGDCRPSFSVATWPQVRLPIQYTRRQLRVTQRMKILASL